MKTKISTNTRKNVSSVFLSIDEITHTKRVKLNKNNYWLLYLIYGDSACDKTATFQIPNNIVFKTIKI